MTDEQATIARLEERLSGLIDRVTKLERNWMFVAFSVMGIVITAVVQVVLV